MRLLLILMICAVVVTDVAAKNYARTIYISSSAGADTNAGTESMPKASINALPADMRRNSRILLRRGDTFFGYIQGFEDCEFAAYGSGRTPIVSGFRVLDRGDAWVYEGDDVWRLDLSRNECFVGISPKYEMIPGNLNNIGCIYVLDADTIIGRMCNDRSMLSRDGDFFTRAGDVITSSSVRSEPFRYIYLKSSVDPSSYGRLAFSTGTHGIYDISDCRIHDLAFVGYGNHGACGIRSSRIERCVIDVIGGSIQLDSPWVRFGNGVELWGNRRDVHIVDCLISRVYDCATTVQCSGPDLLVNITFENNRIYRCRQAFEYWYKDNDSPAFPGCSFSNNVCYGMGDNDFDSPEWRDADILCYLKEPISFKIIGNTFFGGSYFCSPVANPAMRDNTVYIMPGQYLNSYWTHGYPRIVVTEKGFEDAVSLFRERFGDNSQFILLDPALNKTNRDQYFTLEKSVIDKINYSTPLIF